MGGGGKQKSFFVVSPLQKKKKMKTYSHALRKFVNCDDFSENNFDRSDAIGKIQPSSTEQWGMTQTENTADCKGTKLTMTSSRGNGFGFCTPSDGSKPTLTFDYSQKIHPAQQSIAGCGSGGGGDDGFGFRGFGFGGRRREINVLASSGLLGSCLSAPIIPSLAFASPFAAYAPQVAAYAPAPQYSYAPAPQVAAYAPAPQYSYAPQQQPQYSYAPAPQVATYNPPPVQQPVYNLAPAPPVQVNQLPPNFVKLPDTVTIQGPTVEVPGNNYTVSAEQGAQMRSSSSSSYSLPQGTTTFNTSMTPANTNTNANFNTGANVMSAVQSSYASSRPPGC